MLDEYLLPDWYTEADGLWIPSLGISCIESFADSNDLDVKIENFSEKIDHTVLWPELREFTVMRFKGGPGLGSAPPSSSPVVVLTGLLVSGSITEAAAALFMPVVEEIPEVEGEGEGPSINRGRNV